MCPTKQKSLLTKCAPEHTLSVLKPNAFVLKWKRVVSVLSPLSLFSRGGSQIVEGATSNNRVYLQESETTGKCHTLFY